MLTNINTDWKEILANEFQEPYFKKLVKFVDNEYQNNTCYPKKEAIFNAFNHCSLAELKVVIIGQDPYHGKNQANGLCFSVNDDIPHPPSLKNIFKELASNIGKPIPKSGNLSHWAKQGVFLLNATLTVRENSAGSHQKMGWEQFTDNVIKIISNKKENVVFLLWGGFAKKKSKLIDAKKHFILTTGHPSPLSANRGYWFENQHFSKTNEILTNQNLSNINW